MRLRRASSGTLRTNRLGIDEPDDAASISARWLDLVFLPLVGFDRSGVRLGTGGGYYDRAFAFRAGARPGTHHASSDWPMPFRKSSASPRAAHDVRMDAVITDEGFIRCTTG